MQQVNDLAQQEHGLLFQLHRPRDKSMPIIETINGAVSYAEQGAGAPIVLLHGIQGTARTWDTVAPLLSPRYRVVMPNLRGRSESVTPADADAYRLSEFASDLSAVLEMINRTAVIVAWSMGVSVTLELLRRHPHPELRGLVLVSGSPCVGDEARWFNGTTAEEVADEARERGKRLSLIEAAEPHAVAASWQHVKQADFRESLSRILMPALIIHGADDDQCPISHGRQLSQRIPGAQREEWLDTGHNPMAKDPVRLARAIGYFVDSL